MKKISILFFLAAITTLTSCLKDGKVNFAPGASPMTIQWATAAIDDAPANSASNIYRMYTRTYDIAPSVKMDLQVDLTGTDPATEDITVNLGVKTAAVTEYNAKAYTTTVYDVLPTTAYTMPTTVVIPKGLRTATVSVTVNTSLFDFNKNYLLPVSITSVSSGAVSANYGTVLYYVAAKNKYDGIYTVTGTFDDNLNRPSTPPAPAVAYFGGIYPMTQQLRTTGATSVAEYDGTYFGNGYYHPFYTYDAAGVQGKSAYGSFSPNFTMDGSDVVVSVPNYYGQPATNGRSGRIDASGVNKWTISGSSKVMEVTYWLQGPGNVDRTKFVEKWTYSKPR